MHVADRLYDRKYLTLRGRVSISLLSFLFFPTQALSNIPFNVNFEKKKKKEKNTCSCLRSLLSILPTRIVQKNRISVDFYTKEGY